MTESIAKNEAEIAGPFGRAIMRLENRFHSLTWFDPAGGIACKLYPAYEPGSPAQMLADALKCVHRNIAPPPGSRSMRRTTKRGLAPVVA